MFRLGFTTPLVLRKISFREKKIEPSQTMEIGHSCKIGQWYKNRVVMVNSNHNEKKFVKFDY